MRAKDARFDIRTTEKAKLTIENAATFLGTTVSAFILESAMEKAMAILQQAQVIELKSKEHEVFINALLNPPAPNAHLKNLFKKHLKKKDK